MVLEACESAHFTTITSSEEKEVISGPMEETTANGWLGGFQEEGELSKDENW
jgi:hypothetical protein